MTGKRLIACALLLGSFCVATAKANSLAIFRTTLGDMAVELYDEDKPDTVWNFIRLSEIGAYSEGQFNTIFHRLEPGFVVQGGGYVVPGSKTSTSLFSFFLNVFNMGSITSEYHTGTVYDNEFGTIAMARMSTNLDSATSQWFFNLDDNTESLGTNNPNGPYTVFGRVLRGTNVLDQFNERAFATGIVNMTHFWVTNSVTLNFQRVPVTYTNGHVQPQYNELIYPGIDIFQVFMTPEPGGARRIFWNSPSSMVCRLEYREALDGPWMALHVTNGEGVVQSAVDTNTVAPFREYRVRVE